MLSIIRSSSDKVERQTSSFLAESSLSLLADKDPNPFRPAAIGADLRVSVAKRSSLRLRVSVVNLLFRSPAITALSRLSSA